MTVPTERRQPSLPGGMLTASSISTGLRGSTRVRSDASGSDARAALEAGRFDQAPVVDSGGQVVGWVAKRRLSRRVPRVEDVAVPLSATPIVAEDAGIADVVELIASAGFVYVVGHGRLVGFVTPSDLDRHGCRGHFYLLVSRVEMLLASRVTREYDDRALHRYVTGPARQRYAAALARQQEVTVVEYLDLGTLMRLYQASAGFDRLSKPRQESMHAALAQVKAIRNAVMHPNAPLTGRNASRLRDAQRSAWTLIEELEGG